VGWGSPDPCLTSLTAPPASASDAVAAPESPSVPAGRAQPVPPAVDIFVAIEKLGELKARGLLTEEEFTNKKADLLSRL
jgi:hypothetical protein